MKHKIICADCIKALNELEDNSIDSCVTDPPYGLEFMDKDWDYNVPSVKVWSEVFRVLKPGAYLLSFFGTRTYHRGVVNIEDAGFEIKDMILWIYGSGFPKSIDISKAIDKELGKLDERKIIGIKTYPTSKDRTGDKSPFQAENNHLSAIFAITSPATPGAQKWQGFGTALKPACEPIVLAKKPISEHNIAQNVLKWSTGGLNIEECRISTSDNLNGGMYSEGEHKWANKSHKWGYKRQPGQYKQPKGRFPANVILECCCEDSELLEGQASGSRGHWSKNKVTGYGNFGGGKYEYQGVGKKDDMRCLIHTNPNCVCRMLDEQSGILQSGGKFGKCYEWEKYHGAVTVFSKVGMYTASCISDKGGASRFFYQAKASQNERWFYCKICKQAYPMKERDNHIHNAPDNAKYQHLEFHPTQKPLELIRYLIRLVTPSHGTMIDLFMGTGTALVAAEREGFNSIGIDNKLEYCEIAIKRMEEEMKQLRINREPSTIERIGF